MTSAKRSLKKAMVNAKYMAGVPGNLLSAANGKPVRTVLVSSGRDGEGKSTVAVAMAVALARESNTPVLLVDANFRRPVLADWFGVPGAPGFRELLLDSADDSVIQATDEARVFVLPLGGNGSLAEVMTRIPQCLKTLLDRFAYVLFDGDSSLTSSEAALLSPQVDGVVLVAECEQTKWEVIAQAREKLTRLGGQVLGVALNKRRFYIPGVFYGKG